MKPVSSKSFCLYAEENGIDLWFPQTIFEYLEDLSFEKDAPSLIHLFREILVYVSSEPNSFPPTMEEGDVVENVWVKPKTYFVAGIHDYGYWILDSKSKVYEKILTRDLYPSFGIPVVKTMSFRPLGITARTNEIEREV
jgi:hypothetical protein